MLQSLKTKLSWLFRLSLMALLLLAAISHRERILGMKYTDFTQAQEINPLLNPDKLRQAFPKLDKIEPLDNQRFHLLGDDEQTIGYLLLAPDGGAEGYGGKVPLLVGFDPLWKVNTVLLGQHDESPDYMAYVKEQALLNSWTGLQAQEALNEKVEAISGATLSSQAIISGVQQTLKLVDPQQVHLPSTPTFSDLFTWKRIIALSLLLLLFIAFLYPKKLKAWRLLLQLLVVSIFGIWLQNFISIEAILNWFSNGWAWSTQFTVLCFFLLTLLLSLLSKKSFYCTWVCPYGMAQNLVGKLNKRKIKIPHAWFRVLRHLREGLFFTLLFTLWMGWSFDLSQIEPFAAFSFYQSSTWCLVLAGLFLVISLFIAQPWCRFFCPTGYLLDFMRSKEEKKQQTPTA